MIKLYLSCDIRTLLSTLPVRHWRAYTEGKACRYYGIMIFKLSHTYLYIMYTVHTYIRTCKYTVHTCTYSMHTHALEVLGGLWQKNNLRPIYDTVEMGQYYAASMCCDTAK